MNNFVFDPATKFIDPAKVLFAAGLSRGQTVADLGAGSGFYTFAAGVIAGEQGLVYAVDILETALDHVAAEGRLKELRNIKTLRSDLERPDALTPIPTGSVDLVLFGNILHQLKDKPNLFTQAYRLLKTGGKLVVIEWNDQPGPVGPTHATRVGSNEVIEWAKQATLKPAGLLPTDTYHYGLMFIK